jgi:hypothetical protein
MYGDAPRGGGHMHMHVLVDDKGRATKLAVSDDVIAAAGGRTAINHCRVTVRGQALWAPRLSSADRRSGCRSCTVVVKLKPTTAGPKVGKLRIPSNDPDEGVVKVTLRGMGAASSAVK